MKIKLSFENYIGDPYWASMEKLINIQKESGTNRMRSPDKKESALARYLEKAGMTPDEYKDLEKEAKKPWYTDSRGNIIVPAHQFSSALVQAAHGAPAGCRINPEQLRSLLRVSDLVTNRKKCDRLFERYIMPKDGKGHPLSNQRRYTADEVIEKFEAVGSVEFDPGDVKEKNVMDLIRYCGKYVGCGASRKMGYGRFTLVE